MCILNEQPGARTDDDVDDELVPWCIADADVDADAHADAFSKLCVYIERAARGSYYMYVCFTFYIHVTVARHVDNS